MPGQPGVDYMLDRPPYTRYYWDGTKMAELGAVSGDGIPPPDYRTEIEQGIAEAFRLRVMQVAPTVPETKPTNLATGNAYYIDNVVGNNANSGLTPALAFADAWRIPGSPPAGSIIHFAADCVWEYAQTWANYKANTLWTGTMNTWVGSSTNPIIMRPYYPRGLTATKPRISWYALMQSGDWTQEVGISGGKVWSASWSVASNFFGNTFVAFGPNRTIGTAWRQQGTSGAPNLLVAENQYAVDTSKVYVYVPDGSNPNTYYGEVRIFGGGGFACYKTFTGRTRHVKIYGLQFELCAPLAVTNTDATGDANNIEMAYNTFNKCAPIVLKNQATVTPVEDVFTFHDNYIEDNTWAALRLLSTGGIAGNKNGWEIYSNRLNRGNLATGVGGALAYIQCTAGTKHIAWGNYIAGALNAVGNEDIDGAGIYADMGADKAVFAGNIFERCGKGLQVNSQSGMSTIVGNLTIDCGSFGSATNTAGDLKAPSLILAHNTYLWTGRVAFSSLRAGGNIGGTGVRNWEFEPAFEITNSQANSIANSAYNFVSLTLANNAAINMTGAQLANKKFSRIPETWVTTLLVAGNASCGMATQAITGVNSGTDYTHAAKYLHVIGAASDARSWLGRGAEGIARPLPGSPLVAAGASLSQQYQDIGGRNFAAVPTIGCYEVNA